MAIRKSKRLAVYTGLLEHFRADTKYLTTSGFCSALASLDYRCHTGSIDTDIENYPELYAYKPKNRSKTGFWWTVRKPYGRRKRINILKTIISEMTSKK